MYNKEHKYTVTSLFNCASMMGENVTTRCYHCLRELREQIPTASLQIWFDMCHTSKQAVVRAHDDLAYL